MKIDDAIRRYESWSKDDRIETFIREEHRQIADWLKELKNYKKSCDDFEDKLHSMFDHIWDCELDHPLFQDTVGELMGAVIQTYKNMSNKENE